MDQQLEIFCCYAHEDQDYVDELKKRLSPLKAQGLLSHIWSDADINPGIDWEKERHTHLHTAQVILLLVSADFLSSEYCYSVELKQAMERHEKKQATVIPILLRHTYLEGTPFAHLQRLPTGSKPVVEWQHPDAAYLDIVQGVVKVVEAWKKAIVERKRLRQEQARLISLFGYETGGGARSALWTDPVDAELDEATFQQWRGTKRAFTEEEIAGRTWLKIGSDETMCMVHFLNVWCEIERT